MRYFIVDAFTDRPFGGNPAGVVLLDDESDFPDNRFMQQLAAEFRYSETAFVKRENESEFTIRYFTPLGEVELCGHATIASFGVLAQTGAVTYGTICLNHTLAGDLRVEIGEKVMMEMAPPQILPTTVDIGLLHRIMGVTGTQTHLPVMVVSTGLPDIIMPVASLDELNALRPDMNALASLSKQLDVIGVHAFTIVDDGYTAHARNFAPLYGIPEESATGTANAALTHYLYCNGIVTGSSECRILQGEAMGRPSIVETSLRDDGIICVGGRSTIIASGTVQI